MHIEGYRLTNRIGRGGGGEVWLATNALGELVAIKLLHEDVTPILVERFIREARTAATLPSEHVVRVLDVGTSKEGRPYFVMEYLDGKDLRALVSERGPLPRAEAIHLILEACRGLSVAHASGIVHRDIKPANLFLTREGTLKILDFGISKIEQPFGGGMTTASQVIGSPKYMSPEQLRSSRDVDARADIWSLGVVLYNLLSARLPFDGKTATAIVAAITIDPPAAIDVPPALRAVIFRCLEKNRENRFASVADLASALAHL